MISNPTPKLKKTHFFLNLAKSGRSGQYWTGTGPEPDLKKKTGSTGTGTRTGFPVAQCYFLMHYFQKTCGIERYKGACALALASSATNSNSMDPSNANVVSIKDELDFL